MRRALRKRRVFDFVPSYLKVSGVAQDENRYAWTDEGRVRKSVLIFEEPKVLLVRRSSFGWAGEHVLDLAPTFKWCVFRISCLKHARRAKIMANCFIVHWARHAKRARGFDQISVGISDRSVVRSEIGAPRVLKEAGHCQSVRKLLFPFARATAKCGQKGPSMHAHSSISVRQTPKVLRVCSSFGQAGKPMIALKWGGRTNRAELKRCGPTRVRADA